MARLKDRGFVAKRDDSFSRRLEVTGVTSEETSMPDEPFSASAPADPKPKLEFDAAEAASPVAKVSREIGEAKPLLADVQSQKSERDRVTIRLAFRVPDDLTKRAELWAKKARCQVRIVLLKGFSEMREDLIAKLEKGISYTEIPHDRVARASTSLDTSVLVTVEARAKLTTEIDPEGLTGIEAPLSRWARAIYTKSFDRYLAENGY